MIDRDQWQEIMVVLGRNKLRTFLTAFGIFWGIFMLVIMLGSGNGLENGARSTFGRAVTNSIFLWTQRTSIEYAGFNRGRSFSLRNSDIKALKEEIPEIDLLSPRCQAGGHRGSANASRGTKTGAFSIYGDTPDYIKIEPVEILYGRYINHYDIDLKRKVCFIGYEVFNALYDKGEDPIGTYIKAQGVNFKVIGVFKSKSDNANDAEEQEKAMIIPITTFQQTYNWGDVVGWFSITSIPTVKASLVEDKVKEVLKRRHRVHPEDERAFGSWNKEEVFNNMMNLMTGIRVLSLVVGILTLLAGAIGVSNIMVVTVKERTKEFGVRRAIGATPSDVVTQIIYESVVLTLAAGIFGIMLGVWSLEAIASIMNNFSEQPGFFRNPGVQLGVVLSSLGILIFAGIFAGLIPARRAVEVKPVEALRYE